MWRPKIIVLGALEDELKPLLKRFRDGRTGRIVHHCQVTGVGKVQAAIAATQEILEGVSALIVVGTCGGIGKQVEPGSVIVADRARFHDVDATPLGFPRGEIPFTDNSQWLPDEQISRRLKKSCRALGIKPISGGILSGDRFIADASEAQHLAEDTGCVGVDWETAAVAFTAERFGISWAAIRVVSDKADANAISEFGDNVNPSAVTIARIILDFDERFGHDGDWS